MESILWVSRTCDVSIEEMGLWKSKVIDASIFLYDQAPVHITRFQSQSKRYKCILLAQQGLWLNAFDNIWKYIDSKVKVINVAPNNANSQSVHDDVIKGNISALLTLCVGNSPVTGEFPSQRLVTRSFGVFFNPHLNKRLSKPSWGWWFETPMRSWWRHCNNVAISNTTDGPV